MQFPGELLGRHPRHLRQNLQRRAILAGDVITPLSGRAVARARRPTAPGPAQIRVLLDLRQPQEIEGRRLLLDGLGSFLSLQHQPGGSDERVSTIGHGRTLSLTARPAPKFSEIFFSDSASAGWPGPMARPGRVPGSCRGPFRLPFEKKAPQREVRRPAHAIPARKVWVSYTQLRLG